MTSINKSITGIVLKNRNKARDPNKAREFYYIHSTQIKTPSRGFTQSSLEKIAHVINRNHGDHEDLKDIQRGDVVIVFNMDHSGCYENEGTFLMDNIRVVDLSYDNGQIIQDNDLKNIDAIDKRLIPSQFKVPDEYPIRYWENCIGHNYYVPFEPTKWYNQLEHNFTISPFTTPDEIEVSLFYSWFVHDDDEKYYIIYFNIEEQEVIKLGEEPEENGSIHICIDKETYMNILKKKTYLEYLDEDQESNFRSLYNILKTDQDHVLYFT